MLASFGLALAAYLIGSISFAVVSSKLFGLPDPHSYGSGNPGDGAKGWLAVWLAQRLAPGLGAADWAVPAAAVAVFLGHVFPVFHGFEGGKGVATGFGALVSLYPLATGAALVLFLGVVLLTRYVSLGSVLAAASATPFAALFARFGWTAPAPPLALALACATAGLVILKHAGNLHRLAAGTERRLGGRQLR